MEEMKTLKDIADGAKDDDILATARMQDNDAEVGLIIDDSDDEEDAEIISAPSSNTNYTGNGFVMDSKITSNTGDSGMIVGPMGNKERVGDLEHALDDMDKQIEKQRKIAVQNVADGGTPVKEIHDPNAPEEVENAIKESKEKENASSEKDKDELLKEVTILIDKSGMGSFTFTDEEKARIEKAKKIKLVEVENKNLSTLHVKKNLRAQEDFKLIKKNFTKSYSTVIALGSGYTCKVKNISAAEAMRLYQRPGKDTANTMAEKWSLIYDKIMDISRGPFDSFEDFCNNTAVTDYDTFLYGMICSSYPITDQVEFTCNKEYGGCGKNFTIKYENRQMLRQDLITDEIRANIAEIINNAAFLDKAKEVADKAPVHTTKRIMLNDDSGIIVELYVPSVRETIEGVYRRLQENEDLVKEINRGAVILAQGIKSIFIPDYDTIDSEDGPEYYQVQGLDAIVETLNQMKEDQIQLISVESAKMTRPFYIEFGLQKVECPHCHHDWGSHHLDPENVVFQRVQQKVSTEIE